MNFEQARHNMVAQQVRVWEVLEARVLEVLGSLPREDFVLPRHRKLAYADLTLPLGEGQVMMKPVVEGRLLQGLDLSAADDVLEIGTGSGYLTACLARLAGHVHSVDIIERFAVSAAAKLKSMALRNVAVENGDVLSDWSPQRSYDVVAFTGSVRQVPERVRQWLKPGGRLFAIVGIAPAMEAIVMTRALSDQWVVESLFETDLPRLIGAEDPEAFEF